MLLKATFVSWRNSFRSLTSVCWNLWNNELDIPYSPAVCKEIAFPWRNYVWWLSFPQVILSGAVISQLQSNVIRDQHCTHFAHFVLTSSCRPSLVSFWTRLLTVSDTGTPTLPCIAYAISSTLLRQGGTSIEPQNLPGLFHGPFLWKAVIPENC